MNRRWLVSLAVGAALSGCGQAGENRPGSSTVPAPDEGSSGRAGGEGFGIAAPAATDKASPRGQSRAAARGPERAVYSLFDNRLAGHIQHDGGLAILAGSAGFARYLRYRGSKIDWILRAEIDDRRVAIIGRNSGRLDVPLTPEQVAAPRTLRIRVHSDRERNLALQLNGRGEVAMTRPISPGWSTIEFAIPDGLLQPGENELQLSAGKGARLAVEWLHIAAQGSGEFDPAAWPAPAHDTRSLALPRQGGLSYHVMIPEQGRLTGDVVGEPTGGDESAGATACRIAVSATADNGARLTGELHGAGSVVDLAALAATPVRLDLRIAPGSTGCDLAWLREPALVVPGHLAKVERGPPPRHVVLWIMDSLRADRVRIFNPDARPEVPNFERLAETGAVFVQSYVQGNESRVSHASIWSSLYPIQHSMTSAKAKLAGKWTTIDEMMRSAGMWTSGVSANGYVAKRWGFGAAWNQYSNHIHESGGLRGKHVYAKAISSLKGRTTQPWFLYMGTIDTHVAWIPKEPWISQYHPEKPRGRFAKRFSGQDADRGAAALKMTGPEITWVQAIYDSNVSYQDDLLGKFLAQLEEWGIADQTMIIITADHGDEQFEAGRVGHGGSLRETLVHVPLLIHYPAAIPAGKFTEGAEVVDIVPTIADVMGVPMDPAWQGQSLVPLSHGVGRGYPRMSMASMYERAHAARIGSWKLVAPGGDRPQVYDLADDPAETIDRADDAPIARRFLSDPLWLLRAYNRDWRKSQWGNPANVTAAFAAHFGE